jgi:hypothetical protein
MIAIEGQQLLIATWRLTLFDLALYNEDLHYVPLFVYYKN